MNEHFGLERRHWNVIESLLIQPLKQLGCQLWVFGSRARRDHKKFSDLDILIGGPVERTKLASIAEHLEESTIPIRVDLVHEDDLAESYRSSVIAARIPL